MRTFDKIKGTSVSVRQVRQNATRVKARLRQNSRCIAVLALESLSAVVRRRFNSRVPCAAWLASLIHCPILPRLFYNRITARLGRRRFITMKRTRGNSYVHWMRLRGRMSYSARSGELE